MKLQTIITRFAVSALAMALAQTGLATELRFDGFASFVMGQVLDKDEIQSTYSGENNFRGFDDKLGFQDNSKFALQARADLGNKLSATVQIIAKGATDYDAEFNWAYLTYQLTDEWTIKAGRFRPPLFIYSQFLDVGYSYHWITAPDSVYNLNGFDTTNGILLEHQTDFSGWNSTFSAVINRAKVEVPGGTVDTNNGWSLTWDLNRDWFSFHIVYSEGRTTVSGQIEQLAMGLMSAGVSPNAVSNMMMDNDKGSFAGIGVVLDNGQLFAMAEYTELASKDSYSADPAKRAYISGGFRNGNWTAYATVENVKAEYNRRSLANVIGALDPSDPYARALAGNAAALFEMSERDENVYSIGTRYNFHPSASLKLEYMQMDDKYRDQKPEVIAAAVDLVF